MNVRLKVVIITMLVIGVGAILFFIDPMRMGIFPPCPLHRYTGLWCPGCGATRALHQLVHGHLAEAFRFNPLAILALPWVGYLALRNDHPLLKPSWQWALLGVVVVFGVLRNIPVHPFTLLAP
jgi:hypothetical protein